MDDATFVLFDLPGFRVVERAALDDDHGTRRVVVMQAHNVRFPPDRRGFSYKGKLWQRNGRSTTREFREGAVRIVEETGKPTRRSLVILGVNEGTLGNWVNLARSEREGTQGLFQGRIGELKRLRAENAELRMERDVLKRSVVLWVKEATR